MHYPEFGDHKHIAGIGHELVAVIGVVRLAGKPALESFLLVHPFPIFEIAEENVSARLDRQDVEHFELVLDVTLETESLAFILEEYRIPERRRGLHRVRLVLQDESEFLLKAGDFPRFPPRDRPGQFRLQDFLVQRFEALRSLDRRIFTKEFT